MRFARRPGETGTLSHGIVPNAILLLLMGVPIEESRKTASTPMSAAPTLDYLAPGEDGKFDRATNWLDVVRGTLGLLCAIVMAVIGFVALFQLISVSPWLMSNLLLYGLNALMLLALIALAVRVAWFYLGGWNGAAHGKRQYMTVLRPWRWR